MLSGQLPPRKIALPHVQLPQRKIAPWMISPGQLPKDYCPLTISPWKLSPEENCLSDDLSYIIAPRTNGPEENCPPGKLSQG